MKKLFALLLALTMVLILVACGDNGGKSGGGKAWPAADYMPDGIAYAGGGKIVVIVDDVAGGHMIYINGATKSDFDAYVSQLESAGISGKVTDLDEGVYIYGGTKDSFFANLDFCGDKVKTTADKVNGKMVDVEYNLLISLGINQQKQQG